MSSGVLTLINWHEQIHIWVSYVSSGVIGSWTVALKILKWSAARLPDFTAYPLGAQLEPKAFAKKNTLGSLVWCNLAVKIIQRSGKRPILLPEVLPFSKLQSSMSRRLFLLEAKLFQLLCRLPRHGMPNHHYVTCHVPLLFSLAKASLYLLNLQPTWLEFWQLMCDSYHIYKFYTNSTTSITTILLFCIPCFQLKTGLQESGPKMQYKSQCITPLWHARLDACGQAKLKCTRSICSLPKR